VTIMLSPESTKQYEDKILTRAGVPARYFTHTFENFAARPKTEKAIEVAKEWAALENLKDRGFVLLGEPGTGKTHLAVAALRERARKFAAIRQQDANADVYIDPSSLEERKYRFINAPILLDELRQGMKWTESKAQDLYEYCLGTASVVILDDFGKEKATDWATERLYVLIESRYQNLLPTVVTSNRTLDELDDLGYGAAVSRLQETCRIVRVEASDYRPEKGAKSR
jgi:DNA replication protein DnaC